MFNLIKNLINNQLYAISLYSRKVAGAIVLVLVTRLLSVYDYGLMNSYAAIVEFWLMFANLGFNEYILVSSNNIVKEVKLKIGLFIFNAILISVLIGIGGILSPIEYKLIFILVLINSFLDGTFFTLMLPYYQASKKFNLISYINIFYSIMTILIAVISYIFHLSLAKFLILGTLLGIFNFIQCSYYAKINYFMIFKNLKRIFAKIDKSVFAYTGVTIGFYLYNKLPSVYVSSFAEKEHAALFFAAFAFANLINLFFTAQIQKIVPEMINCSIQKTKQVLSENLKFALYVTCIFITFITVFGKNLLKLLYGKEYYMNSYPVLIILTIANIFIATGAIFGAYITASGNQKLKIPMMFEASLVTILGLLLFNKFDIYGAAFAFLLSAIYAGLRFTITGLNLIKEKERTNNV